MRKIVALAAVAAASIASPTMAVADTVPGVYVTGASTTNGTDNNYTMTTPDNPTPVAAPVTDPAGPWVTSSTSSWLGNGGAGLNGNYGFATTFDLSGYDPASAVLTGSFAADNTGLVYLNGTEIGSTNNGYTAFTNFSASTGFLAGINTLSFVDGNSGGPFGLNVSSLSVSAAPLTGAVPEPATWAMMLLGFGAIGFVMRRKRTVALATA